MTFTHPQGTNTVEVVQQGLLAQCLDETSIRHQPLAVLSFLTVSHLSAMAHPCCHHPALCDPCSCNNTQPRGWSCYWTSALCKQAGSRYKCSSNHIIAYTVIVLHCRIKRFFHIKYRSQTQSLLYPLTHFIKFTSFLLCLCTSVPSAVCTKSY